MKKYILILLTFFMMIKFGYSQKEMQCLLNFENPLYCWGDTLWIDTVSNHNNVWQIGQPNKTTFQSSYSAPNAIVTKLDTCYPTNDTSSFIIAHEADFALRDLGTMWIDAAFKINSDTLSDFGTIEFSPDNGFSWINLLTDTLYAQQNLYHWANEKPVFSGNSTGWQWFSIWITDPGHYFNIYLGDTVLWRFTFISDSNQSFKDGWMLDDIFINDWYEGINELHDDNFIIFPNPANENITIETTIITKEQTISIYNMQGQLLLQQAMLKPKTVIDISNFAKGVYFIKLTTAEGVAVKKFIKE